MVVQGAIWGGRICEAAMLGQSCWVAGVAPHTFWNLLFSPVQSRAAQAGSSLKAAYLALAAVPNSAETGLWRVPWEAAGHPGQRSAGRNPSRGPVAGINFTLQSKHFPSAWSTDGFSEAWKGETVLFFGFYYYNREMKLPGFSSLQGCTTLNTAGCKPRVAHYLCSEQLQIISVTTCLRNDLFLHKLSLVSCDTTWRY